MAATRVLLLLSGRAESPGFAHSVCRLLGAGPGLGPWSTHCGLKRGRLVLSDEPLPGASTRLPLQVGKRGPGAGRRELAREAGGRARAAQTRPPPPASRGAARINSDGHPRQRSPFCPFAALEQQFGARAAELPTNRGVDLGVAVILQSSDQTVLLTRRTSTLSVSPNLWVPPGECPENEIPKSKEEAPHPAVLFPVSGGQRGKPRNAVGPLFTRSAGDLHDLYAHRRRGSANSARGFLARNTAS